MPNEQRTAVQSRTPAGLIAAAWIVVSLPLAWGIYNTALSAAKLFTAPQAKPPALVKAP